jgi:hypothetical protein
MRRERTVAAIDGGILKARRLRLMARLVSLPAGFVKREPRDEEGLERKEAAKFL